MRPKSKTDGGFTLVELLVVIAIIGILIAILLPTFRSALGRGQRTACIVEIQEIEKALHLYERDYMDFPPSSMAELGLIKENGINSGIESLVACLSSTSKDTEYFAFPDDRLENSDGDRSPIPLCKLTGSCFKNDALWEFLDPWGNPYIYFHSRDLNPKKSQIYIIQGKKTKVVPHLTPTKTGRIRGYGRYQVISCGLDGIPTTSDDLISR